MVRTCSILSSIGQVLLKKKHENMEQNNSKNSGILEQFGNIIGGGAAGAAADMVGYGIGELTGINKKRREQQLNQQRNLTQIQEESNKRLMDASYANQLQMWHDTNYSEQIKEIEKAGLSAGLIYGGSGAGGSTTGSGSTSVGGGSASDEASLKNASTAQQGMGLQLAMMQSQIEVNKSIANKNNTDAELSVEKTTTESQQRGSLIEKLTQEGIMTYLNNVEKNYKLTGDKSLGDLGYNGSGKGIDIIVSENSLIPQEAITMILKAKAEAGNQTAQEALNNKKTEGYMQELINATAHADADKTRAAAIKLSAEWDTGEFTNWKTWVDLGKEVVNTIGGIVTKGMSAGKAPNAKVVHQYGDTNVNY